MKDIFIILLSALSLTVFAQDKKRIVVSQPRCENTIVANLVKTSLSQAFADSDDWQPIERPSKDEMNRMLLEGGKIGDLPTTQYVLSADIQDMQGMCFISCLIFDKETGVVVNSATEMSESSPQNIQQACASLAKQLLEKP